MTVAARLVLEDCEGALEDLREKDLRGPKWRRRWFASLALLRTVGHVLDKVDGERDPYYRAAIDAAWKAVSRTKPEPAILWAFIDSERNTITKEYRSAGGQGATVHLGQSKPVDYHYQMNYGPFAGRDHREVVAEAIAWWDEYLEAVEEDVAVLKLRASGVLDGM